ncbi:hypothetical protein AGMMS49982_15560 [Bacteroidia bacterium]|nr:hypothetical protein AGMMS49982_15560 [Bacteroidia bacterium]
MKKVCPNKIKIMVGSTVYGFEDQLFQIVAYLESLGYEVVNSHVGKIEEVDDV